MAKHTNKLPEPKSEFVFETLNNKGVISSYIDEYTQQFINEASQHKEPALEIGAAYGFVTRQALKKGAKVIANDIEKKHLEILYHNTPKKLQPQLTLLPGEFPYALNVPDDSIGSCYTARTLGYLTPNQFQLGLNKLFSALKPGAKLYILASPPHMAIFEWLLPIYLKRVKNKNKWPGYFTNILKLLDPVAEDTACYIENKLHFFDEQILKRELAHTGFEIINITLFERKDIIARLNSNPSLGIVAIAKKPCD
jgi:Methyltransferase domain